LIIKKKKLQGKGFEAEGRTLRIPIKTLLKNCFAKLNDPGGSVEFKKQVV
jgi:hypothetical protein